MIDLGALNLAKKNTMHLKQMGGKIDTKTKPRRKIHEEYRSVANPQTPKRI